MIKLYSVTVYTEEQIGFSAENKFHATLALDSARNLHEQVVVAYSGYSYAVSYTEIEEIRIPGYTITVVEN